MVKRNKSKKEDDRLRQIVKAVVSNRPSSEHKYFDQIQVLAAVSAGNLYCQSDITRGDEVTQRIGNQVMLKNMDFRCSASINSSVDKAMIRFILFVDRQGYNAPVVADVLEPANLGTAYTDLVPYHWDYRKRFSILHDEVIPLNKYSSNAYTYRRVKKNLNLQSYNIGASTTFANQVYILIIGSELNVLNLSTFQWSMRIEYTDD